MLKLSLEVNLKKCSQENTHQKVHLYCFPTQQVKLYCIRFSSLPSGGTFGGKWTLHSANTGRVDHTGGEAANRLVQEGR